MYFLIDILIWSTFHSADYFGHFINYISKLKQNGKTHINKNVFIFKSDHYRVGRVGRVDLPDHQAKKTFFPLKSGCFSPKIGKKKKKLSKSVSGYFKTKCGSFEVKIIMIQKIMLIFLLPF